LQTWLDGQKWPSTIQFRFRGADEEQKKTGEFLGKAAAMALFLMFIILLTQFNSFYQTILTLSTVILAIVGVLIGLMVTGQKFSMVMTGTGVVALAGIVVNNAIVLIDTYNRMRGEGMAPKDAILKTSAQRLRPIMLTTITTIFGLVPMALQINMDFFNQTTLIGGLSAIWWVPLSTAVISGLAFSTLLTLVMIPTMLALPYNIASSASITGKGLVWVFHWPANTIGGFIAREKQRRAAEAKRVAEMQREAEMAAVEPPEAEVVNLAEKRTKAIRKIPPEESQSEAAE
jgi:multidrug efflux pump